MKKLFLILMIFIFCYFCISEGVLAATHSFAVIGDEGSPAQIKNIYKMLNNLDINYKNLTPSQVTDQTVFNDVDAIISFAGTSNINEIGANAVKNFANDHVVISHGYDFDKYYYSEYSSSLVTTVPTITYLMDWGNFRDGDEAIFHRGGSSDNGDLRVFSASQFDSEPDSELITKIAEVDGNVAIFKYGGTGDNGFYVMDLMATTDETQWAGIWHIFPAVKMVKDFPTGKYARWMSNGRSWPDLTWVNNHIDTLVGSSDIAEKMVIGQSAEGRDINAIVIGKGDRYAIIDGCIHGNEKTTAFAALRIAELLLEYYDKPGNPWQTKLNQYKVIIIPVLNPDGYYYNRRLNSGADAIPNTGDDKDLNRQFPPGGTTTEPEAWALRDLVDTYKPTIYFNLHEGGVWYPLHLVYGEYQTQPFESYTVYALNEFTRNDFEDLKHWGYFTEENWNIWIGDVYDINYAGPDSMAVEYTSKYYDASSILMESFVWSQTWHAKKSLWGLDYYTSIPIGHLKHYDYDQNFLYTSDGFITSTNLVGEELTVTLDTSELTGPSTTLINDLGNRGMPTEVIISGGGEWSYGSNEITITGATNSIVINWGEPIPRLVGYWKFDEGPETAVDSSGNGNDGTINGASWTSTNCISGFCLDFDGFDEYVDVGNSNSLNPTQEISVSAWIFTESYTTYPRIVSKETGTIANPYALELFSPTNIKFLIGDGGTETGTPDINVNLLNKWVHVVGTYDGEYIRIYVNGRELTDPTTRLGGIPSRTTKVLIGNNPDPTNPRQFNGIIDEVKIYNYALAPGEILDEYNSGTTTTVPIGGGCPTLFVHDGKDYVKERKSRIHSEDDVIDEILLNTKPVAEGGVFSLLLKETTLPEHSHIDSVRLFVGDEEVELISAFHSRYGDVTSILKESDDVRTDTKVFDEIELKFRAPEIEGEFLLKDTIGCGQELLIIWLSWTYTNSYQ